MGDGRTSGNNRKENHGDNLTEQISRLIQDAVDEMDFNSLSDRMQSVIRESVPEVERFRRYVAGKVSVPGSRKPARNPANPVRLPGTWGGPLRMVLGGAGLSFFGILCAVFSPIGIPLALEGGIAGGMAAAVEVTVVALTGLSGWIFGQGIRENNRVTRIRDYVRHWQNQSYIMFSELQSRTGRPFKQIREDVRFLLERDLLPGSRMDEEETCLLLTDEAIQLYEGAKASQREREEEAARREKEEEQMAFASDEEKELYAFSKQAEEILSQISDCRSRISSGEMKKKIDRFELALTRIFVCVKERPEKLRKTGRLMDYYIPSVMRLLSVYEEMEEQPVRGENITKTCREIENSMDTINEALTVMYDELFQEDALDVSADIQVLQAMLARDGWTDPYHQGSEGDALTNHTASP